MKLVKKTETGGKECSSCGEHKPLADYHNAPRTKDGLAGYCKTCHKERTRNTDYIRKFGITLEDYNQMFAEQEGKCGICGKHDLEKHLSVDHDHDTGEVRGLLCQPCNLGLGKLGDNIESIENTLRYLNGDTRRNSNRR